MTYDIVHADILSWAASYDGEPFHAAFMDAPYEMEFMGREWDNTGIAFNPETWKAIARCLHPGAFLFVFAGTINDDLISVAMRQAGLRKYHRAMAWGYGSGFPKAARLDTVIDRRAGIERTKIGTRKHQPKFDAKGFEYRKKDNGYNSKERETFDVTAPATELAQAWAGHRYGGQVLKPAVESILIFQKPYKSDPVSSITATGAGALWVDGGRIAGDVPSVPQPQLNSPTGHIYGFKTGEGRNGEMSDAPAGRWPANLLLQHSADCNGTCAPDCPVRRLGEQSGETESKAGQRGAVNIGTFAGTADGSGEWKDGYAIRGHDDTGTAARFFFQADFMYDRLEDADPVVYEAKSSRAEREAGLDPRQVKLLGMMEADPQARREPADWGRRIGGSGEVDRRNFPESTISDGRAKSIDNPYQRGETTRRGFKSTGFDSTEIVMVQLSHNDQTASGGETWASQGLEVMLQVDTAQSPPRVIDVSTTQYGDATQWNTLLFGNSTTAPSLKGIKFTTKTKISSTTESITLNWLTRLLTNDSTVDANCAPMDGGSLAENVESSSPSLNITNVETVSFPGVGSVASQTLWTISANAKLEVSRDPFPPTRRTDGRSTEHETGHLRTSPRRNSHPCIKPIALARHLATLLLPPACYTPRRLLVPFSGAGSEMIGALLAGWDEIVGVELEQDHCRIAEARLAYWQQRRHEFLDPSKPITAQLSAAPDGQLDLFEDEP